MKEVKYLVAVLHGAALASAWFVAVMFGSVHKEDPASGLWVLPVLGTTLTAVFWTIYCIACWHHD